MKHENAVSSFLSDFLGVGTARAVAAVCGLATSLLLTYAMGEEGYGVYRLFFTTVALIGVFGGSGWLAGGILRYGTDEYVESGTLRKTFGVIAPIFVLTNLILVVGVYLFWNEIRAYFKLTDILAGNGALYLTMAYVVVFNLILVLPPYFQSSRRMLWFAFLPVIPMVFFLAVPLTCQILHWPLHPLTAAAWLFSLNLVVMLVGLLRLLPSSLPPRWSGRHAGKIIRYSYPVLFSSIAAQAIYSVDLLAINKVTGDERLAGIYGVAQLIYTNVGQVTMVVVSLMAPLIITMLVKKQEGEIDRFVHRIAPQMGWVWAVVCGLLMLLAREVIAVFPGGFAAGGPILIVLLLALSVRVTTMVDSAVYTAYAMTPSTSLITVLMAVSKVLALVWLVPRYGMFGAAWANCVTAVVSVILRVGWLYYRKGYNTAGSLVPLWPLIIIWPVAFLVESWWIRLLVIPVFFAVHFVYGRTARLFTPDSLEIVDRINMPERWRRAVHRFYALMNPRAA